MTNEDLGIAPIVAHQIPVAVIAERLENLNAQATARVTTQWAIRFGLL